MTGADCPLQDEGALRCGAGPFARLRFVLREIAALVRLRLGTARQRDKGGIR
jgi:hypothetical protein